MRNLTIQTIAEAVGGKIENAGRSDLTKEVSDVVICGCKAWFVWLFLSEIYLHADKNIQNPWHLVKSNVVYCGF